MFDGNRICRQKKSNKLDFAWQLFQPPSYRFESSEKTDAWDTNFGDLNWSRWRECAGKTSLPSRVLVSLRIKRRSRIPDSVHLSSFIPISSALVNKSLVVRRRDGEESVFLGNWANLKTSFYSTWQLGTNVCDLGYGELSWVGQVITLYTK